MGENKTKQQQQQKQKPGDFTNVLSKIYLYQWYIVMQPTSTLSLQHLRSEVTPWLTKHVFFTAVSTGTPGSACF